MPAGIACHELRSVLRTGSCRGGFPSLPSTPTVCMNETWPNFFLVGAARSGTTALYRMLGQHPDVFVSPQKETQYFTLGGRAPNFRGPGAEWGINKKAIAHTHEYLELFSSVRAEKAIGEGSVSYLYYPEVAHRIRQRLGIVKILAVLREPASRAYSNYQYLRSYAREPLTSFEAALEAEEERMRDGWEHIWFYRDLGFYHRQLVSYERCFGRENLHIILHEDLRSDPEGVLRSVFSFLGVDSSRKVRTDIEINASGQPRSEFLTRLLLRPSWLITALRYAIPKKARLPLETAARRRLLRQHTHPPVEVASALRRAYQSDILSLEKLLDRDLASWLNPPE